MRSNARIHFIFLTWNAFQAFVTNAEQAALLQRVRAHLDNAGLFAFETHNSLLPNTRTRDGFFPIQETRLEPEAGPSYVRVEGHTVHGTRTQILHLTGQKRWQDGARERTKTNLPAK